MKFLVGKNYVYVKTEQGVSKAGNDYCLVTIACPVTFENYQFNVVPNFNKESLNFLVPGDKVDIELSLSNRFGNTNLNIVSLKSPVVK